jgi:negative regulator of replication initiation
VVIGPARKTSKNSCWKLAGASGVQATITVQQRSAAPEPVSEQGVSYILFGQSKHADNAIDALLDILRTLAERNPTFVERLAPAVRGRTRNHIAREREDVYPGRPDHIEQTTKLASGWWLGTNIANREKMRIIEKACEIEKLKLGHDISITLPNA